MNIDLYDVREKSVIKSNDLIQKARFSLDLQQQKIILYLISQIQPGDEDFKMYSFSIREFCDVCGINNSGKNYADIKRTIKEIADKSRWIRINPGTETLIRWIEKVKIDDSGIISIRLDEDLKPYLLQLKSNFTKYELLWTLAFRSKYSIRLYEVVKSVHYHEFESYTKEFSLEQLRGLLDAEKLTTWQRFKDIALEKAIDEINRYSDKLVEYEKVKKNRSVVAVKLTISEKPPVERLKIQQTIENTYNLNQLTIWDTLKTTEEKYKPGCPNK